MKFAVLTLLTFFLISGCGHERIKTLKIAGEAQGTTYHITWLSDKSFNFKQEVDSLLKGIDLALSTYVPTSIISRINKNEIGVLVNNYFRDVFNKALEVSEKTGGAFDITVAPVINAWGFGFTKKAEVDSAMIDTLLQYVGFKRVWLEDSMIVKAKPQVMLDFNAIAQGYSVDVLAAFLESKGITNYLVELGGEVKAKGEKEDGEYWKVGIDKPSETLTEGRPLQAVVKLRNRALATSGNYRKYYEENGQKYSHIIDPHTGYPAKHHLLSATVIAPDCMTADAYATAFMVMGLEKAKRFLTENAALDLDVFFIYNENSVWKTYTSETAKEWIEELP
jgi:thiamine biosynthesis lipoprotein